MTVQRKYTQAQADEVIQKQFGISVSTYLNWCDINNLSVTTEKTPNQIQRELLMYKSCMAHHVLAKNKKGHKNNRDVIHSLCESKKAPISKYSSIVHYIPKDLSSRTCFLQLVDVVHENKTKILDNEAAIRTLIRMANWYPYWVRDASGWESNSHSLKRQIASLLRHLFAKYPVPLFMDSAWESDSELHQEWYVHVGDGNNIRTAKFLPFPLTKMMAHNFLKAPNDFSIKDALVYGEVITLNGNLRIANALRGTSILNLDNTFRPSFIKFLIDNPMLDTRQYGPILDYIHHIKYQNNMVQQPNGGLVENPIQPNFSMNGRSAVTLVEQVERWHRELNKSHKGGRVQWDRSGYISPFKLEEGENDNHKVWAIIELTSSAELMDEGRAMKHCVSSYAASCVNGNCSIWSLRKYDYTGNWRLITIEVSRGSICQARGPMNRTPTPQEWRIISQWAQKNNLTIPSYIK